MARVLACIEGSEDCPTLLGRTVDLIGRDHEFVVLTVVGTPVDAMAGATLAPVTGPAAPLDAEVVEATTKAATVAAEKGLHRVADATEIEARARVETGEPGSTICRVAQEERVDVVVVGPEEGGLVHRILTGSVAIHVVRHAPCPVLVMRGESADS